MVTRAKRRTNNRWDRDNMAVLSCKVRKDFAERFRETAAANGHTINGIIRGALDAYLEEHEHAKQE